MSYLFSLSRYQTKCVIKLLFRKLNYVTNFKIYLRSSFKAMANRGKTGDDRNTKN